MTRVLVVGELNPDLILQGYRTFPVPGKEVLVDDFVTTLGSASAICAMGLARLGNEVAFVAKVGQDPWGDYCLDVLRSAGIDVSHVVRDPSVKTGVTVSISSCADRALVTYLGAIAALEGGDVADDCFDKARHLHVSSYFLQQALHGSCRDLFARARARGLTTSLDPGFDPADEWGAGLVDALTEVDVFLPNEVELEALGGTASPEEALRRLQNGHTLVVAKLGARGAVAMGAEGLCHVPGFRVETVDTTGAGDSFNAGFLHAWLQGQSLRECLRFGNATGALSTRAAGGTGSQASAAEVAAFLASRP